MDFTRKLLVRSTHVDSPRAPKRVEGPDDLEAERRMEDSYEDQSLPLPLPTKTPQGAPGCDELQAGPIVEPDSQSQAVVPPSDMVSSKDRSGPRCKKCRRRGHDTDSCRNTHSRKRKLVVDDEDNSNRRVDLCNQCMFYHTVGHCKTPKCDDCAKHHSPKSTCAGGAATLLFMEAVVNKTVSETTLQEIREKDGDEPLQHDSTRKRKRQ